MKAVSAARTLSDAAAEVLLALGPFVSADLGTLWELNAASGTFGARAVWRRFPGVGAEFEAATRALQLPKDTGPVGRALGTAKPIWLESVNEETLPWRAEFALRERFQSAWFVPLVSEKSLVGVLEFFSCEPRQEDPELLQTLAELCRQIVASLERASTERVNQAKLQRLYESDLIGIITASTRGTIYDANDAFLRMVGYSRADLEAGLVRWDSMTPPAEQAASALAVQQLQVRGVAETRAKRYVRKDGSTVPVLLGIALLEASSTDCIAFVLDHTAHAGVEERLAELNVGLEKLVEARTTSLRESEAIASQAAGKLAQSEAELRAFAARLEAVRENERTELARELHDVLGQELTGLKMDAAWVMRRMPDSESLEPGRARLDSMRGRLDTLIDTGRRIATRLRPGLLDDLGLADALEWHASEFAARSGLTIELKLAAGTATIDRDRAIAVFRIFQELLTNVARHADAHRVEVSLTLDGQNLIFQLRDDGRGIEGDRITGTTSLGLTGVRERARAFGGDFQISGGPGLGTTAVLRLPLAVPEHG